VSRGLIALGTFVMLDIMVAHWLVKVHRAVPEPLANPIYRNRAHPVGRDAGPRAVARNTGAADYEHPGVLLVGVEGIVGRLGA
jgi:hypothetical protein